MVPETNMPVRFYLTPNREDGSASILVAEPLDYETTRNFMLRVRAQNVAAVPLAAFTMVTVNVTGMLFFSPQKLWFCQLQSQKKKIIQHKINCREDDESSPRK